MTINLQFSNNNKNNFGNIILTPKVQNVTKNVWGVLIQTFKDDRLAEFVWQALYNQYNYLSTNLQCDSFKHEFYLLTCKYTIIREIM